MSEHPTDLDNLELLRERDAGGLFDHLAAFGAQLLEGSRLGSAAHIAELENADPPIRQINFCGMGGSAISGDLIGDLLGRGLLVPLQVYRRYTLPVVDPSALVIVSSYSGNTAEALSCFEEARERELRLLALTTGGRLLEAAGQAGIPVIVLPTGLPPRCSIGLSCGALLSVLSRLRLAEPVQVAEWVPSIRDWTAQLAPEQPAATNPAKQLALRLQGKIPVVYASEGHLGGTGRRWVSQLAENGKQLGWFNLLPEMNHNEIVGWKHPQELFPQLAAIFLHDRDDHPDVSRRLDLSARLIEAAGASVFHVESPDTSWPERLWSLVLLGDYASAYAGILNQEDPSPVPAIDELKHLLRKEMTSDNKS